MAFGGYTPPASNGSVLGLTARHFVLRRVYVVWDRAVYCLTLDAWVALCGACMTATGRRGAGWAAAAADALRGLGARPQAQVPFHRWEHYDLPWGEDDVAFRELDAASADGASWSMRVAAFTVAEVGPDAPPPVGRAVDVETRWRLSGPADALLKRLPPPGRAMPPRAWRAEVAEVDGWRTVNAAAAPVGPGYLYLAVPRAGDGATGRGPVKLGWSREPAKRVGRLRSSYGLAEAYRLLSSVRGEPHEERALHDRLAQHRAHVAFSGEWYRPAPAVLGCLDAPLAALRRRGATPRRRRERVYAAAALVRRLEVPPSTRRLRITPG